MHYNESCVLPEQKARDSHHDLQTATSLPVSLLVFWDLKKVILSHHKYPVMHKVNIFRILLHHYECSIFHIKVMPHIYMKT